MSDGIFPIDTRTLNKGDELSAEWCEATMGVKRHNPRYRLALLKLKERIIGNAIDDGRPLSIVIKGDGLRIQHDNEASVYHDGRSGAGVRMMARGLRNLNALVDQSALTAGQLADHARAVAIRAMQVQAVRGATRIAHKEMAAKQITGEACPDCAR